MVETFCGQYGHGRIFQRLGVLHLRTTLELQLLNKLSAHPNRVAVRLAIGTGMDSSLSSGGGPLIRRQPAVDRRSRTEKLTTGRPGGDEWSRGTLVDHKDGALLRP